jgi:NAD(P)-dependent dehydrogenase (short-subunit alcohol dehydrogenase family)
MGEFSGKTAFVTGCSSGIGRQTAHALARAGANVAITDINGDGLEETRKQLEQYGVGVEPIVLDVADPDAVNAAVARTVKRFGGLHCAHNNAGIMGPVQELLAYTPEVARKLFDVNVFGVLYCMQAQLRHMLDNGGGAIVNTASVSGVRAVPMIGVYTSTKHAVIGLTKAAAVEYSARGVRINAVCPGFVKTNMTAGQFTDEVEQALGEQHPIGRFSQPEEIAEAVIWLLGPKASFSTGCTMFVDGGQTC